MSGAARREGALLWRAWSAWSLAVTALYLWSYAERILVILRR